MADKIKELIETNGEYDWRNYNEATLREFQTGLEVLRTAYVYVQRIDWLVSGDDGEESFLRRLKDDLTNLNK